MQRLLNSAKSMQEFSAQASVYVPITNSPSTLPSYVTVDTSSTWHTSALQATALESMTLPARLLVNAEARTTLAGLEAAFNNHGNRKIASLGMSIADPDKLDGRMQTDDENSEDISLLPSSPQGPQRLGSRAHLFGSAQALRGSWESDEELEGVKLERRDRFQSGPIIHKSVLYERLSRSYLLYLTSNSRYQTAQLFPQLSSFPHIFSDLSTKSDSNALAIRTSLSTSSVVSDRIKAMSGIVRRFVALDEREALCNGLEELCDEYIEGWESESDEDDDVG